MSVEHRLHRGDVEVADRNDPHQVRPVPIGVKLLQPVRLRILNDLHLADREPLRVARSFQDDGELFVADAGGRAQSETPFFSDDATLLLDLHRIERHVLRPVLENQKRPVENVGFVQRHLQLIDRLIEARVGVQVRTEPHTDRFHETDKLLLRKMRGPVERHVLDEVSKSALVFVFEN